MTSDHIAVMRSVYSHHGIYDGYGGVYEYQGDPGNLQRTIIHSSLAQFANDSKLYAVNEGARYAPNIIVRRAEYRLHESEYNLFYNNCENYATWCRLGAEVML